MKQLLNSLLCLIILVLVGCGNQTGLQGGNSLKDLGDKNFQDSLDGSDSSLPDSVQETSPKTPTEPVNVGGTEVTSPYLRKVIGHVDTAQASCPFVTLIAEDEQEQEFEGLVHTNCHFEAQLQTQKKYRFTLYQADNTPFELTFNNKEEAFVEIQPGESAYDLGGFDFQGYLDQYMKPIKEGEGAKAFTEQNPYLNKEKEELQNYIRMKQEEAKKKKELEAAPSLTDKIKPFGAPQKIPSLNP